MAIDFHAAQATTTGSGTVDYRLARASVLRQYEAGEVSLGDICDIHPELRRAAINVAEPIDEVCPVCEDADLRLVSYVFGPRLPKSGRCISRATELERIDQRKGVFIQYVVEVCPSCSWNHLRRAHRLGQGSRSG